MGLQQTEAWSNYMTFSDCVIFIMETFYNAIYVYAICNKCAIFIIKLFHIQQANYV